MKYTPINDNELDTGRREAHERGKVSLTQDEEDHPAQVEQQKDNSYGMG